MFLKRLLPLCVCIAWTEALAFAAEPSTGPTSYTLEDVLNLALEKNPQILTAKQEVEKARGVIITAKARLYPQVQGTSQLGYTQGDVFQSDTSTTNDSLHEFWAVSFGVTQSLYSGGVNRNNIAISQLQQDNSFIDLQVATDETLLSVKQTFYSILLSYSEIEVQKQNIALLKVERDRQQQLFDAGRSTKFNVIRLEVNLANEEPVLLQEQNDLRNAEIKLSQLVGLPWNPAGDQPPFYIKGSMACPPVKAKLESLIGEARARRPELRKAANQIGISERQIQIDRASNIPRIDAFVGGRVQEKDEHHPAFFEPAADVSMGILGRWDIFDGYAGKGRAISSEAALQQARIGMDALNLSVDADVRTAYNNLEQARRTLQALSENVTRAEKALELSRLSADTGFGTALDVLQATVDLARSRNSETQARYRYMLSLAQLERAVSLAPKDWDLNGPKPTPAVIPQASSPQAQLRQEVRR